MKKKGVSRRGFLARGLAFAGGGATLGVDGIARAASTSNAIVQENALPGTPETQWDLVDTGQFSGAGATNFLEGFTTDISVNRGQTVSFKINTDCANYRIEIYRLGYYGGKGARLLTTLQVNSASLQPAPLQDLTVGLIDAGNWAVTSTWAVPATAVSGVYLAHLVRQDGVTGENHVPFVVRDDGAKHDVFFQTSDTTWHAYNGWGGANHYGGSSTGSGDGRAFKVSYNRPIATRDGIGTYAGPQDFLFGAEYAAIRWLEANGYDVSYTTGVDTTRRGAELLNHKVFVSTGHDEYWSGDQRTNVEAARAAGVHLIFMSGNEVFWKTRWEPSLDASATPYRTHVCYKESRAGLKIDPSPLWTGSWRDPSFSPPSDGGRPENGLTGTMFQVDSYRADSIQIPYAMTQLRFWRNTPVAKTASGKSATLVQNLLGYEWDQAPANGFQPAGLVRLSSTTLSVTTYLLDWGLTDGPGTATHNLTLYRDPKSGAIVFGAGTVFWSWGLDADHDLTVTATDPSVRQAMVNLLAEMAIQPQTLQTGLVAATASTDKTAPKSVITAPTNGTSVVEGQLYTVKGTASDTGGLVATVEVSTDGGASWHFATGTTSWTYPWYPPSPGTYRVLTRATDDSLNLETPAAGVSVSVTPAASVTLFNADVIPSTMEVADPNPYELGVKFRTSANGTAVGVRFYKGPNNTGSHVGNLWGMDGTRLATVTFANETATGWQQANFGTPVSLTAGSTYVVSYHTSGNYAADPNYFLTPRTSGPLTTPATANGVFASGTASAFPTSTYGSENYWVDVVFKRAGGAGNLAPSGVADGGFATTSNTALVIPAAALLGNDNEPNGYPLAITGVTNPLNGTASYDPGAQAVTFTPAANFPSPAYTGNGGFTYQASNGHGGTASAAVTVAVSVPTYGLFGATDVPGTVTVSEANSLELGLRFQTSTTGKILGLRFYKGPQNTGTHTAHLWSSTGSVLATATFSGETASGWQQVYFQNPVSVAPGQTYVASYHTSGNYSADTNYFASGRTNGPLTAPAGSNGVYAYGSSSVFPKNSYASSNYWVDVIFAMAAASGAPVATSDGGFFATLNTPLTIASEALLYNDNDPSGYNLTVTGVDTATNGTVSLSADGQTITFTPTSGYLGAANFRYLISNGQGGTGSATVSLTVGANVTLFGPNDGPASGPVQDNPVELGVTFTVAQAGKALAIRFYKSSLASDGHVVNLWNSDGSLAGSGTTVGETPSGWQQVNLSSPVSLVAGGTYTASYHSVDSYVADSNYFVSARTSGPLTAPAGSNGVYAYGTASVCPLNSYASSNYYVDVVFQPGS